MEDATQMKKGKQARRWCFTWNNPPEDNVVIKSFIEMSHCSYYVIGYEIAPTTGTKHLQGYMEFSSGKRFETLKQLNNSIHWSVCNGSQEQNKIYCTKGGIWIEGGTPGQQGHRTDLEESRQIIDRGGSMLDVAENNFGSFVRYHRGFERYQYLIQQRAATQWRQVEVFYLWGETGTGKTRSVREANPIVFCPIDSNTGTWWTGYNGEKVILFDDFRGTVPLHTFLKWLDGYPVQVPVHGGATFLNAEKIYITSNVPLEELYRNCDQRSRDALRRRINTISYFSRSATEVTGNTRPSHQNFFANDSFFASGEI